MALTFNPDGSISLDGPTTQAEFEECCCEPTPTCDCDTTYTGGATVTVDACAQNVNYDCDSAAGRYTFTGKTTTDYGTYRVCVWTFTGPEVTLAGIPIGGNWSLQVTIVDRGVLGASVIRQLFPAYNPGGFLQNSTPCTGNPFASTGFILPGFDNPFPWAPGCSGCNATVTFD